MEQSDNTSGKSNNEARPQHNHAVLQNARYSREAIKNGNRLQSLDFFKRLVVVLLMAGAVGLYSHVIDITHANSLIHLFMTQYTHVPWHGIHFWDLIQPAFMVIAGTVLLFLYYWIDIAHNSLLLGFFTIVAGTQFLPLNGMYVSGFIKRKSSLRYNICSYYG